jgi:hypothetical protein
MVPSLRQALLVGLALCSAGVGVPLGAQSASAPALKAAFLLQFVKFTEWPQDAVAPEAPLVLCVVEDSEVARQLEQVARGRDVQGHSLSVRRMNAGGLLQTCQMVYVGVNARAALQVIETARAEPVLTVSDYPDFAARGGTAQFYVEDGRIRFAVNLESAQRSRLRLSSRLLSLARIVKDGPS